MTNSAFIAFWFATFVVVIIPLLIAAMFLRLDPNVWVWRMLLLAGVTAGIIVTILLWSETLRSNKPVGRGNEMRNNITYNLDKHTVRGHQVDVMEVFIRDKLVASIYPSDNHGLRIMTRYLNGPPVVLDLGEVAAINVEFREPPA